ncbi:MAG TPA: Gfo/Idh/MocA family oxidoreductase [Terriglobales bacterium]|nr:Gfo/Idh/MocA family oxidoreductase [Terriglobales bacterium]
MISSSAIPASLKTRILIVGAGSIGERHTRVFRQLGVPVAVVDPRRTLANQIAHKYGCFNSYGHIEEVPLHEFDAAVICTPADSHVPLADRCAHAGLHLLVEKPFAAALDGVENLISFCHSRSLVLAVAYVLRTHPTLVRARELVLERKLGQLLVIQAACTHHVANARPDYKQTYFAERRSGGGVIFDLSHELNYLEWIAGPMELLHCRTSTFELLEVPTEGEADLLLRVADRAAVNLHLSACDWNSRREFHITGTEASLTGNLLTGNLALSHLGGQEQWCDEVRERDALYRDQANAFMACIHQGITPPCSGEAGLQTLSTCLAALERADEYRFSASGRAAR